MKTVTLTEPEFAGTYDVAPVGDGKLVLSPILGPTLRELEEKHGFRSLREEEFEAEFGELPRDGEG